MFLFSKLVVPISHPSNKEIGISFLCKEGEIVVASLLSSNCLL